MPLLSLKKIALWTGGASVTVAVESVFIGTGCSYLGSHRIRSVAENPTFTTNCADLRVVLASNTLLHIQVLSTRLLAWIALQANETILTKVRAPGVSDLPVVVVAFFPVANHQDCMVHC